MIEPSNLKQLSRQIAERAARRPHAFWRVQAFLPEAKTLLPGELISPGSFEIPGSPQSAALWGDLLETSQMDLFSMFG